jgi:hypothetical protein
MLAPARLMSTDRYRLVLAFVSLGIGFSVYLVARTTATYVSLPFDGLTFPGANGSTLTGSLPSFCHTFAFGLATAVLLRPWPRASLGGIGMWVVIESAFEIAQSRSAGFTFDPFDLLAIVLGGAAAWLCVK